MRIHGLHPNDWVPGMVEFIGTTQPAWVKVLNHDRRSVERAMALSPDTKWLGRKHKEIDEQKNLIRRREDGAERFFRDLQSIGTWDIINVWEGLNEPGPHPTADYYRFEVRLADLLWDAGKEYVAHQCSVGTWAGAESDPMHDWRSEWSREVLRRSTYLGLHEYCAPRMDTEFIMYPEMSQHDGGYFTLRYRKVYKALPDDCRIPLLVTECGIDSGAAHWDPGGQGGWRSFTSPDDYIAQLRWYHGELRKDDYVAGMFPFCLYAHDPTWNDTFGLWDPDIRDLYGQLIAEEQDEEQDDVPDGWTDVRQSLARHPDRKFGTVPISQKDEVIIHHSGGPPSFDVYDIALDHVLNNGWAGIGYHIVIDEVGEIFLCHDLDVVAAHCKYHNDHTVGICLLGDFQDSREPTQAQFESCQSVLVEMPFDFTIKGHQEYRPTICPGSDWPGWRHKLTEADDGRVVYLEGLLSEIEQLAKAR